MSPNKRPSMEEAYVAVADLGHGLPHSGEKEQTKHNRSHQRRRAHYNVPIRRRETREADFCIFPFT